MTVKQSVRTLTALELDTIRVALTLLIETHPASVDLLHARGTVGLDTILSDDATAQLNEELATAHAVTIEGVEP